MVLRGGADDPTYWYWTSSDTHGGGFTVDIPQNILSSSDYSIGLRFAFNDLDTGYNKIIDYQNRTSDNGFYFNGRKIKFYPGTGTGTKTISPGEILDMVVTRNGTTKLFTVYFVVGGVLTKEFEYTDTNDYAMATIVNGKVRFGFFDDDTAFAGSEATSDGKVYSIKLWNGAIGESSVSQAMDPKYLVTFNDNVDGVDITMPSVQEVVNGGKAAQPTNPTRTNYTFGSWYTTSGLTTQWNFSNDTISQNTTLYAKWTITTYSVSFLAGSHGSITGTSSQTVSHGGDTTEVSATADSGYHFTNWSDSNTQNPRTISGVDTNISVTANFAATDADAPIITLVSAEATNSAAVITWVTNEDASSKVQYGLNTSYGFITSEINITPRVQNHSATLSNLKACAHYYYRVLSKDATNNQSVSAQKTFNTTGCAASEVTGGTESAVLISGGAVQLTNSLSVAKLGIPEDFAAEPATFQINKLDINAAPAGPDGKTIAHNNFYNLVAVTETDIHLETFDKSITFTITYGSDTEDDYDENTLDVYKYADSSWSKKNCVLDTSINTLTCTLTGFSVYAVLGQPKSNSSSSTSNSSTSSSSSPLSANCTNTKPFSIPDLFQIDTADSQAKLFFTPVDFNQYYISFSTNPYAEMHGELVTLTREGVQSENIYFLEPNTLYYAKVRGQNGCMPGDWSNIMQFKTDSHNYYRYFPTSSHQETTFITESEHTLVPKEVSIPSPAPKLLENKTTPAPEKKCILWFCW